MAIRRVMRLCFASLLPALLCLLLAIQLETRSLAPVQAAPEPAIGNCFASLGTTTQFASADASAVQQAVDAASPGALVKLAGDCAGVLARGGATQTVIITLPLRLQGGYTITNWLVSDPLANPTTLDAQRLGTVVNGFGSLDLMVANLTVQHGKGPGVSAGALLTLSGVTAYDNRGGGAIATGEAFVTATRFVSNLNPLIGGGLEVYNGGNGQGRATVVNSQFISNVGSTLLHSGGGGMYAVDATVIGSQFIANVGMGAGGGLTAGNLVLAGPYGRATVIDSQFISNTADVIGGGLYSYGVLAITGSQFLSNTAGTSGGAHAYTTATVSSTYFAHNAATSAGGALTASGGKPGTLLLDNVQFIGNTAGQLGGALASLKPLTVSASLFEDNRCGGASCLGGGIYLSNTLAATGTQFLSNTATNAGAAVYVLAGGSLHNSCVVGNQLAAVTNVTHTLDATNDFWGAADGPAPIGSGDTISGTVTASPFLPMPLFACPLLTLSRKLYLPAIVR